MDSRERLLAQGEHFLDRMERGDDQARWPIDNWILRTLLFLLRVRGA